MVESLDIQVYKSPPEGIFAAFRNGSDHRDALNYTKTTSTGSSFALCMVKTLQPSLHASRSTPYIEWQ